ncbi:centromere protein S isoform X1 [Rattus norvegicus]|uniref:centromere protein S isoform X1 n=1 Tax=Rattus norvegicus TaxID=10116 RepID=UPI002FD836E0
MEEVEAEEQQQYSHRQRLKAAVHYTVGCLCQEVELDKQVHLSKQTIAAISEKILPKTLKCLPAWLLCPVPAPAARTSRTLRSRTDTEHWLEGGGAIVTVAQWTAGLRCPPWSWCLGS